MQKDISRRPGPARFLLALFFVFATLLSISFPVFADVGPKPSVSVAIKGLPSEEIYDVTLLSKDKGGGRYNVFEGKLEAPASAGVEEDIWAVFVKYKDPDGFYYLQYHSRLTGEDTFSWGYYPPDTFKVLLYFPKYGSFVVSNVTDRYTFESYYTLDLRGVEYKTPGTTSVVNVEPGDPHFIIAISDALIRVVLTLAIELLIALAFGYRAKKQLIFIAIVNIVTQILMNAVLVLFRHEAGFLLSALSYVLLEFVIFTIEAILYAIFLKPLSPKPISRAVTVLYAFLANIASCVVGLISGVFYYLLI